MKLRNRPVTFRTIRCKGLLEHDARSPGHRACDTSLHRGGAGEEVMQHGPQAEDVILLASGVPAETLRARVCDAPLSGWGTGWPVRRVQIEADELHL
jgi:hypothetical protein